MGQVLKGGGGGMYKAIIIINVIMNALGGIITWIEKTHVQREYTIRLNIYIVSALIYFAVSISIIGYNCYTSKCQSMPWNRSKTCCNEVLVGLCLLIAGELYLTGDNILIIFKDYETVLASNFQVKDLRSYLVGISLCFMIIGKLIPFLNNAVDGYINGGSQLSLTVKLKYGDTNWKSSDNEILLIDSFVHKERQLQLRQTLEDSMYDNQPNSQPLEIILLGKIDNGGSRRQHTGGDQWQPMEEVSHRTQGTEGDSASQGQQNTDGQRCKVIVRFSDKWPGNDFVQITRLTITTSIAELKYIIEGEDPTFKRKMDEEYITWSANFQTVCIFEQNNGEKGTKLFDSEESCDKQSKTASINILRTYAGLLDYALIADAIYTTILDEITQGSKKNCPIIHAGLAIGILGFLNFVWVVTVILVFFIFCIFAKKRRKPYKAEPALEYKYCGNHDEILEPIHFEIQTLTFALKYCKRYSKKIYRNNKCCLTVILVSISPIIFILGLFPGHVIIIMALLLLSVALFLLVTHGCCCCITESDSKHTYYKCCNGFITVLGGLLTTLYLPVYMLSDNQWPWTCYTETWFVAKFVFSGFAVFISSIPVLYNCLKRCKKIFVEKMKDLEKTGEICTISICRCRYTEVFRLQDDGQIEERPYTYEPLA
jgi:hypothetical protein